MEGILARRLMRILWPAFLAAAVAEVVFFSILDPLDLHVRGLPLEWSRQATYTMGFFGFWGIAIASSALTMLLETSTRNEDRRPGGYFAGEPDTDFRAASDFGDKGTD
jgi:hypothetical protein